VHQNDGDASRFAVLDPSLVHLNGWFFKMNTRTHPDGRHGFRYYTARCF
jgi:hypothetical protein